MSKWSATSSRQEEQAEMVSPPGGVLGMSSWEETPRKTLDTLEGLQVPSSKINKKILLPFVSD